MRVLLVGGTGVISSGVLAESVTQGHDVTVVTRGRSKRPLAPGVRALHADVRDRPEFERVLAGEAFDVVVNFMVFTADHARDDVQFFSDRVGRYFMISSAAVYATDPMSIPIKESTPLGNEGWDYAVHKAAAERVFVEAHAQQAFPAVIVRPAHTYDHTSIPTLGGWTDLARMIAGEPVIVHGDGTSVRMLTHSSDFARGLVGLYDAQDAEGESFHITTDEMLTWNGIFDAIARAAGVEAVKVHVASDALVAAEPTLGGPLFGDRSHSKIFDNAKIRSFVPGYRPLVRFADMAPRIVEHALDARGDRDPMIERIYNAFSPHSA